MELSNPLSTWRLKIDKGVKLILSASIGFEIHFLVNVTKLQKGFISIIAISTVDAFWNPFP